MSIVAKPIKRGSRQLILLCIYLSLSMWTTFAMYSLQIYKYSKNCPQYSDLIILYDSELDANIVLRDEVAIGFQKHRVLINKMLKENPSLLPHIINFLMNSYGEHIGFDLMEESAKSSENPETRTKKTSKTLKMLMKKNNNTRSGTVSMIKDKLLGFTIKPISSHTEFLKSVADDISTNNGSLMMKILQQS